MTDIPAINGFPIVTMKDDTDHWCQPARWHPTFGWVDERDFEYWLARRDDGH